MGISSRDSRPRGGGDERVPERGAPWMDAIE